MSNLEILTDSALKAKYGITPQQYADFAVMRGDPSDGLPGVVGVGEKTAVSLLNSWGDLDGIVAAAGDDSSAMAATVRVKFLAAADYLAVAPKVVEVVRDLELSPFDARIRQRTPEQSDALDGLSNRWGLGGSLQRARHALDSVAAS
jgi:5'-3' exonuclease